MLQLADLSFRGNWDAAERAWAARSTALDAHGNAEELRAAGESDGDRSDSGESCLSTGSDAELILPDREDVSGLQRRMVVGLGCALLLLVALRLGEEQSASGFGAATRGAELVTDHYSVLGLSRGASAGEVDRAFRRLSRASHPDACSGQREACAHAFGEMQRAAEVLRDPALRARLDAALPPTLQELAPVLLTMLALAGAAAWLRRGGDGSPEAAAAAPNPSLGAEGDARKRAKRAKLAAAEQRRLQLVRRRAAALVLQRAWSRRATMYASRVATLPRRPAFMSSALRGRSGEQTSAEAFKQWASFLARLALASMLFQVLKLLTARVFPRLARQLGWLV
jgi:curved DNA-binding protein CbpA